MKSTNLNPTGAHADAATRGTKSTAIAGSKGMIWRDASTESEGQIRDMTVFGAKFIDNDDGTGALIIGQGDGGGGGSGGGAGGGTGGGVGGGTIGGVGSFVGSAVPMLNNSGGDLPAGSAVVADETETNAVTTTTTVGDNRIAGVLQEDIAAGVVGKVLFNGFTGGVITTGPIARGYYLRTSATAGAAEATEDRVAGSFAVLTTGADFPTSSFVRETVVTEAGSAVASLAMDMPLSTEVGRVLFLALWRNVSETPTVTGWTRVGATAGFYYYYRVTTGGDTCTATWATASAAIGVVMLLSELVDATDIVEAQDFDATTAAADLSGLSDAPRYALAVVHDDPATPADWSLVVTEATSVASAAADQNLAATVTTSATNTAIPDDPSFVKDGNASTYSFAGAGATGSAPVERWWISDLGSAVSIGSFTLKELTYANAFETWLNATPATLTHSARFQYSTVGTSGPWTDVATTLTANDGLTPGTSTWTFTPVSARYWRIFTSGKYANNTFEGIRIYTWAVNGTTLLDALGTIVGQFIGRDAAVTSPFTGADAQNDAIFAFNLTDDPLPSALLYGPDLATPLASGGGVPAGAILAWDGDSWEPAYPPEPLILEDGTVAILEDGSAAMSEPVFI